MFLLAGVQTDQEEHKRPQYLSLHFPLFSFWTTANYAQQWEAQHALSDEYPGLLRESTSRPIPISSQASMISCAECGRNCGDRLLSSSTGVTSGKKRSASPPSFHREGSVERELKRSKTSSDESETRLIDLRLKASGVSFLEQPFNTTATVNFWLNYPDKEHWTVATRQISLTFDTHHTRSGSVFGPIKVSVADEERTQSMSDVCTTVVSADARWRG